jgi:hypothetical protein
MLDLVTIIANLIQFYGRETFPVNPEFDRPTLMVKSQAVGFENCNNYTSKTSYSYKL